MFCAKCGQEIPSNSAFCTHCGSAVEQPANQRNTSQADPNAHNFEQPYWGGYQSSGYQPQRSSITVGKVLLTVTGVLFFIGGIASLISCFQSLSLIRWFGAGFIVLLLFEALYGVALLIGGIGGVVFSGKPDKSDLLILIGIAIFVLKIIDWILAAIILGGLISTVTFTSAFIGCITPVLYVIGAYKNKTAG